MENQVEDIEQCVNRTDERIDLMVLRIDAVSKVMCEEEEDPEVVVSKLMQSVLQVKDDYHNLRREVTEVQAMQQELSNRLQQQLMIVQEKCLSLKEKLATAPPHHRKDGEIKSF